MSATSATSEAASRAKPERVEEDDTLSGIPLPDSGSFSVSPSLLAICRAMGSGLKIERVLNRILRLTIHEMQAQQGSILLFDQHEDRLDMLATFGMPAEIVEKGYIPRKGSIAEWVIENAEPLIINDSDSTEKNGFRSLDRKRGIHSAMCMPLWSRGGILGTINLNRTEDNTEPFGQNDLDSMTLLASQAAIYIENSRLHESITRSERLAAIGQTVAGVSHCMKNLLTGMKGGLSLAKLGRDKTDWDMASEGLRILESSVLRVSSLALDMLNYSKQREPQMERVNLETLFSEIRGVTRDRVADTGSELIIDIAEIARECEADGDELFRAMLNLVQNALDANGKSGKVTVSTEASRAETALKRLDRNSETAIIVRVADEGPGVSQENYQKIFDPFYSTKGSRGTGLGLAVTRKIIEEHGGTLELESAPGESAVFAIYLPPA